MTEDQEKETVVQGAGSPEGQPQLETNQTEGQADESAQPVKMTLEEAIKQKLAQKKQAQANDKFNPKQAPNSSTMRNQHGSNRNSALGRRNKV